MCGPSLRPPALRRRVSGSCPTCTWSARIWDHGRGTFRETGTSSKVSGRAHFAAARAYFVAALSPVDEPERSTGCGGTAIPGIGDVLASAKRPGTSRTGAKARVDRAPRRATDRSRSATACDHAAARIPAVPARVTRPRARDIRGAAPFEPRTRARSARCSTVGPAMISPIAHGSRRVLWRRVHLHDVAAPSSWRGPVCDGRCMNDRWRSRYHCLRVQSSAQRF
jgi:hypothetical protein